MDLFHKFIFKCLVISVVITNILAQYNPTILQDTRNEPKVDGTFGFLYRTEDGISHAAKGEPGGHVVGRFTYTDPTGLKVNFNYNAGSGVTPKYNYNAAPAPVYTNQGVAPVQEERRTKPPALQQQPQQPQQQPIYYQPVQQQPQQQPIQQNFNYQPVQPAYQPQPVYQPQPLQPQGLQHPLANLQQDPYLPEDDGTYHPELDAQYEYHDSDNTVNNNVNNQFLGFGKK